MEPLLLTRSSIYCIVYYDSCMTTIGGGKSGATAMECQPRSVRRRIRGRETLLDSMGCTERDLTRVHGLWYQRLVGRAASHGGNRRPRGLARTRRQSARVRFRSDAAGIRRRVSAPLCRAWRSQVAVAAVEPCGSGVQEQVGRRSGSRTVRGNHGAVCGFILAPAPSATSPAPKSGAGSFIPIGHSLLKWYMHTN
jgi:hypothetical protein